MKIQRFLLGYAKAVELLIENGATIDSVNEKGQTPLHKAAEYGNLN